MPLAGYSVIRLPPASSKKGRLLHNDRPTAATPSGVSPDTSRVHTTTGQSAFPFLCARGGMRSTVKHVPFQVSQRALEAPCASHHQRPKRAPKMLLRNLLHSRCNS